MPSYIRSDDVVCVLQFSGWAVFLKDNWDTATFVTNYIPLIMFPILYIGAKWWKRSTIVRASEMDFQSGLAEIEADTYDEPPPKNKWEAFWQWLVCVSAFYLWADLSEWAVSDVIYCGSVMPMLQLRRQHYSYSDTQPSLTQMYICLPHNCKFNCWIA